MPVRSLAPWSTFAAVIEWAKALFFVSFLIHGRLRANIVAGGDLGVDPGSAGVVMMVVRSKGVIRRRIEREVLSKIKLDQAAQVSYSSWIGRITDYMNGSELAVDPKEA
jgi:hypothetical protein